MRAGHAIELVVNGERHRLQVPPRLTLVDCLRDELGLTGTHVGCEHGVCGACTVLLDGEPVRACLLFAVQAEAHEITTVEGLTRAGGEPGVLQEAFREAHGLQCGYCTPGMLIAAHALLEARPDPADEEIREALAGNLCRCNGYGQIVAAVRLASRRRREAAR